LRDGRYYIDSTINLKAPLAHHFSGNTSSAKGLFAKNYFLMAL